ncbi:anti-sigma factor domain-containing protein [Bacillus sp. FJAT-47783]|uniref:anti-sigma factor domain-containing protein n=1 Tax=Bacillus sp. FJAT-47783 TaxID=2922712 RepID=UPI001FAC0AFB|nr:anti-sigma factor domain-containing protein [Bacillus sp. FJAT-47783]
MKKGVVIEVNERFVTLLTPDGQFVKTNNVRGSYALGEEISFPNELSRIQRKASIPRFNGRIALALAVVMLLVLSIPIFQKEDVYAYMTIDINPSFELEIDSDLLVTDIKPLNKDAKQIVKELSDWKNRSIQAVTDKIISVTENEGYLKKNQEIMIATIINSKEKKSDEKLEKELNEMKKTYHDKEIKIETIKSDIETRKKAENKGISTGKYIEKETKVQPKEDNNKEKANTQQQRALNQKETMKKEVQTDRGELNEEKEIQNETKTPRGQLKKEENQLNKKEKKEEKQLRQKEKKEEKRLMREQKKELRQQMKEQRKEEKQIKKQEKKEAHEERKNKKDEQRKWNKHQDKDK